MHTPIVKLSPIRLASLWRLIGWFSIQFTVRLEFLLLLFYCLSLIKAVLHSILKITHILAAIAIFFDSVAVRLTRKPTAFVRIWFLLADIVPQLSFSFNHRPPDLSSIRCAIREHQISLPIFCLSLSKMTLVVWTIRKDAVACSFRKAVFPSSAVVGLIVHDVVNFFGVFLAGVIEARPMVCVDSKLQSLESVSRTSLLSEGCFSTGLA